MCQLTLLVLPLLTVFHVFQAIHFIYLFYFGAGTVPLATSLWLYLLWMQWL